jgi:acyl carrier protein
MKKNDFYQLVEENLEFQPGTIKFDTVLNELEEWDSLSKLILITIADDYFNKKISGQDLKDDLSISSYMKIIGIENFED